MTASRILTIVATVVALTVFQGMALADFSFDLDTPPLSAEGEVGFLVQFHNMLTNTGSSDDTYTVSFVKNAPEDWTATICEGATCYPPFITEIDVPLTAGSDTNLDMDLTPGSVGSGSVTLTVTSVGNPSLSVTETFYVTSYINLDFAFNAPDQGAVGEIGILQSFHTTLTNNSDSDDIYTVSMVKNAPEVWTGTLCEGETCYPPFITEIDVELAAGNQTNLDIDLTPGDVGDGSLTITITSGNNPSQYDTKSFYVVTPGLDVLLVAGDNAMGGDSYYLDALSNAGKTVGTWPRQEAGSLSNLEINEFGTVVWLSGIADGGLVMDDFAALAYLVQHGGNLFLSGQNLAYESCDPASPHFSSSAKSWFNSILKTDYAGAEGLGDIAAGFDGDLVTDGLFFNLNGGDGANNNNTMDALTRLGDGVATLEYSSANLAAVRSYYGDGKTFFCGFAFEGIDTAANRNALMNQVMLWFDGLLVTPVGDVVAPLIASIPYATPNPFNPQTNIKFEVGGTQSVPAEVTIYNLKGQAVRNLMQGTVSPGPQNLVWDGRSDDGRSLATGIYMARVRLADQSKTVKMTLVK
jgi:hypothetical protein